MPTAPKHTDMRIKLGGREIDASARAAVSSFFSGVGTEPVAKLLKTARLRTAHPGELLIDGEQVDQAGLLIDGILRTVVSIADGRSATIHYMRPVGFVGLPTIYLPVPLRVYAITKAAVIKLDGATLHRAAREFSELSSFLSRQLAGVVLRVPSIIEEFGFKTVTQRIASHLIALSEPEGLTGVRSATVTQTTLAEYVGSAREVVWRCLRPLIGDGLVSVGFGSIRIIDEAGLRRLAGQP